MNERDQPTPNDNAATCDADGGRIVCPICRVHAVEKKQKWFCPRCGQMLQTCCD